MLVSTQTPERITPRDQLTKPKKDRIVYLVDVADVYAAANFDRAVAERGASYPDNLDMIATMRRGVEDILSDDADKEERAICLDMIDQYEPHIQMMEDVLQMRQTGAPDEEILEKLKENELPLGLKDRIEQLELMVARGYAPFAAKLAARNFYLQVIPIEAFRLFVMDVENAPFEFRRGRDGVPDDVLRKVSQDHRLEVGFAIRELMRLSGSEEKNSGSPLPGTSSPKSSATAKSGPKRAQRRKDKAGASKKSKSKGSPSTPAI